MKRRLERGAHAALGVVEGASPQVARSAFLQLTKIYHPAKFAREAPEVVRHANEVFLALRAAYESIAPGRKTSAGSSSGFPRRPSEDTPGREPSTRDTGSQSGLRPPAGQAAAAGRGAPRARPPTPAPPSSSKAAVGTQSGFSPGPTKAAGSKPATSTPAGGTPAVGTAAAGTQTGFPRAASVAPGTQTGFARGPAAPAAKGPGTAKMPPLEADAPGTTAEEDELESAMTLLRRKKWVEARKILHALSARVPAEKRYRALLAYARGREAQDGGRHPEARTEFNRALTLDPELGIAKSALAQVTADEPAARPTGGLFTKLFKK